MPRRPFLGLCWVVFLSQALSAQWIKYATPGTPLNADGTPNLSAAAPRTADGKPDLSGVWKSNSAGYHLNITADLKPGEFQPWTVDTSKQRISNFGIESPMTRCLPYGPVIRALVGFFKIIQSPNVIAFLYEDTGRYRQVFMDGRSLPDDPNPSWGGYSIGRWEADTLIVESTGFNDKSWLDFAGHPHSEALRLTERFRRIDFGHMELQLTIDDPKAYRRPWTVPIDIRIAPDTDLLEDVCDNERSSQHFEPAGKRSVVIAPNILALLVGTYEERQGQHFVVTLVGDELFLQRPTHKVGAALIPLSATSFVQVGIGAAVQFMLDAKGNATGLTFVTVESETKAAKTK